MPISDMTKGELQLTERYQALGALINDVARAESEQAIYLAVSTRLAQILEADRSSVALLHDGGTMLGLVALDGVAKSARSEHDQLSNYFVSEVVARMQPGRGHLTADSDYVDNRALAAQGFRHSLLVPLCDGGTAYGTVNVARKADLPYDQTDELLLSQISDLVSVSLVRLRSFTEATEALAQSRAYGERLKTLYGVSHELAVAVTEEQVFTVVEKAAQQLVAHDRLCYAALENSGKALRVSSLAGVRTMLPEDSVISAGASTLGVALKNRKATYNPDLSLLSYPDARAMAEAGLLTSMNIPIMVGGKPIGSLNLAATGRDSFAPQDRDLLTMFGQLMATTMERVRNARTLALHVTHDDLTGLPNRRDFTRQLNECADQVQGDVTVNASVCVIDLDHFKSINDTLGHDAGDACLLEVASILTTTIPAAGVLARLGGDEFAVLLPGSDIVAASEIAEAMRENLESLVFRWNKRPFPVTASIGVAQLGPTGADAALRGADDGSGRAKDQGRNRLVVTEPHGADGRYERDGDWIGRINEALDTNSFELYAQPIVPLNPDDVVPHGTNYEMLVRMIDVNGDVILPSKFIGIAEHYGLITRIDEWVITHALEWLDGPESPPIGLCTVNVSAHSIESAPFLARVLALVGAVAVDPTRICFEITETAAVRNVDSALSFMSQMSDRGCRFALDDFGSGFSSFTTLKRLPVDFIKIDGSLVRDVSSDDVDKAAVTAIQALADALGITTIAEFVERAETVQVLREIGVTHGQGYHLGRPQPLAFLTHDTTLSASFWPTEVGGVPTS